MTEEFLELALSMSSARLDHDRRPWIVGVGHLMGTPFSEEFSEETFVARWSELFHRLDDEGWGDDAARGVSAG